MIYRTGINPGATKISPHEWSLSWNETVYTSKLPNDEKSHFDSILAVDNRLC